MKTLQLWICHRSSEICDQHPKRRVGINLKLFRIDSRENSFDSNLLQGVGEASWAVEVSEGLLNWSERFDIETKMEERDEANFDVAFFRDGRMWL